MGLSVLLVLGIVLIVLLWRVAMRAREFATVKAVQLCQKWDAILLDDAVCLHKMRISRSETVGHLCLFREYAFDYSYDGVARHRAFLQFNGNRFIQAISDNEIITPDKTLSETSAAKNTDDNNVIDLNAHRDHQ